MPTLKKKEQGNYSKPVHLPRYLDKGKGRQAVTYTEQAVLKRETGYVGVSGIDVSVMKFPVEDNTKIQFIRKEEIKKHKNYQGKRIQRGLYQTREKKLINADVNGSYNIMKKYFSKKGVWNESMYSDCIEVCSTPAVLTVNL